VGTNEREVDDLEEPRRDALTQDSPAIIFVTEREEAATVSIVGQTNRPNELNRFDIAFHK
jgi:hypothetical protein